MDVILFSHTHWDREWYKPFQYFRIRLSEVINDVIEEFSKNNINFFYLDGQTIILEDYLEIYPEKALILKDLIKKKKLFAGPWYVLADEFLVSGESLIRNLLIGINQAKEFGGEDFFGYLPDSFGHNSEIPKILSSFNIKRAVLWRGAGDKKSEFLWKSDDESCVLTTYLTEGYFQDIFHSKINIKEKIIKLKELLDKLKEHSVSDKILLPAGGDHLGVILNLNDLLTELNGKISGYNLKQGKISEYFDSLNKPKEQLDEVKGELRDNEKNPILPGAFSSRLYLKQMNALSTWKLSRIAEPLQTFLNSLGLVKNKKNELNYAWKLLLKNHPHDSICGCSVDDVHEENISRFKQVDQVSDAIIARCINKIADNVSENSLFVCNLSNNDFSGVISVKTHKKLPETLCYQYVKSTFGFPQEILVDTQKVPFCEDIKEFKEYLAYVENIPSFSIKTVSSSVLDYPVEVFENKIKNSLVEVIVNVDGSINLKDIKSNKLFENLHIIVDRADMGDTYTYSPLSEEKPLSAKFIRSEIKEKGDLRSALKLFYKILIPEDFDYKTGLRNQKVHEVFITTEISLLSNSKRVEFNTFWENTCKNHIMQIKFKFPEKIRETISENTLGLIKRTFDPDYRLEDHIPAEKGQELKTNSAPMQRFVYSQGLGIIAEGLSEYVASKNSLYVTILRATGMLSALSLNARNFPAGPAIEVPAAQCLGKCSARYALYPTEQPESLFKEADEFMGSIIAEIGLVSEDEKKLSFKKFLNVNNDNIIVYAVKQPENSEINGVVIRLFNISDESQSVHLSGDLNYTQLQELNSLEETISERYDLNREIVFKAKELKSFLIN
ncbi:MAG TPA: glycoside hydrolase family 38 C-terminal domain-containing protein [Candidatus Gastranaerophilales bacterium]|nr:glycoside hydrolase family 38 C-terminal domain-containing protein [Candidatus Gastranaerophilales bacterium]